MKKNLETRGNIAIQLFNTRGYDGIRFDWIKRLPEASFSYDKFMEISKELIDLTKKYQKVEPLVKVRGFSDPQDCLKLHSLSGGQDDETARLLLDKRNSYSLESFTKEDYEKNTEPMVFMASEGKDSFAV